MKRGIAHIVSILLFSIVLFKIVTSSLHTDNPANSFFLAMIISYLIIEKNQWIVDSFIKIIKYGLKI